jgi:hypothetical protein
MPRALGTFLKLGENERLTRHHYYLQLPDVLMDVVERDPTSPQAEHLAELAHSFAHDLLNLSVLASRLLWYEALTPDMSRSPDLVGMGTDVESVFLFLKATCDLLAEITVEVAIDAGMRGQVPSDSSDKRSRSFDKVARWVRNNPTRIDPAFHFLAHQLGWFNELHGIRTNLAHRGYDTLIYTNRVFFSFGTAASGRIETRLLRERRGLSAGSYGFTRTPLLPFVKRLARSMMCASDQIASASLARLQLEKPSRTHALCGVYVPGLHGLDSYEPPTKSPRLKIIADCLQRCGEYLTASKIGFPDGHWWQFLIAISEHFGTLPAHVGEFGEGPTNVLVDWNIIFIVDEKRFGIMARDVVSTEKIWLESAKKSIEEFASDAQLERTVLVSRRANPPFVTPSVETAGLPIVLGEQAPVAARDAFELLMK